MNIVMLDEERVLVERQEEELARKLRGWGMKPIRCAFTNFYASGGSFHCATLDVRRRGSSSRTPSQESSERKTSRSFLF